MKIPRNTYGPVTEYFSPRIVGLWLAVTALLSIIMMPAFVGAATLLSQSYTVKSPLPTGSIVSLQKGTSDQVEAASTANVNYILGVTIDGGSSEISISSDQKNQVHVATSGIEQVLISDMNGSVSTGDPITASPISGVGMKATNNAKIIGTAQDNFPNNSASKKTYKDDKGQEQTVKLGSVATLVNVAYYYRQPDKTIIPTALQNLANALAGKKVDSLPILISLGIFIVAMIVVVSIVYSMIHSSIISVGRNPMSQAAIYRNVIQLSALVIVILGVAVGSIYMVLTRL